MLWLSLYFPYLALQIFSRSSLYSGPLAVRTDSMHRPIVYICNQAAQACGIQAGMKVTAAQALAHDLIIFARNEIAEQAALARLAGWAGKFTSFVSLAPPHTLLLEVAGSLKFFGGVQKFIDRIKKEVQALGFTAGYALSPTPAGSLILAKAGSNPVVPQKEVFIHHLNALPLKYLGLDLPIYEALSQSGLKHFRDIPHLPRAALSRRFGEGFVNLIDRLVGRAPDPQIPYTPPLVFHAEQELPFAMETTEPLLFALNRLVLELVGWLKSLEAGTNKITLNLDTKEEIKCITLNLLTPSRKPRHLMKLLQEHIDNVKLMSPVNAITIRVEDVLALGAINLDFFEKSRDTHLNLEQLLERLTARLGKRAVSGVGLNADHRPEKAFLLGGFDPSQSDKHGGCPPRPLWFLPQAQALAVINHTPFYQGLLHLALGPERIETGWWDGLDVMRDYYVAQNPLGSRFWIYQDRRSQNWFLQGIFS